MKLSAHQNTLSGSFSWCLFTKGNWIRLREKIEEVTRNHYTFICNSLFGAGESCLFSHRYLWEINNISNVANVFFFCAASVLGQENMDGILIQVK